MLKLSIIIPVYFNQDNLLPLYNDIREKVLAHLDTDYEIIFVDDGSKDNSYAIMQELARLDPRILLLRLSRNFGEHAAILAGLSKCTGDCAVRKAADLQEPSELILQMLRKYQEGNKVVLATRADRDEPATQKAFSTLCLYHEKSGTSNHAQRRIRQFPDRPSDHQSLSRYEREKYLPDGTSPLERFSDCHRSLHQAAAENRNFQMDLFQKDQTCHGLTRRLFQLSAKNGQCCRFFYLSAFSGSAVYHTLPQTDRADYSRRICLSAHYYTHGVWTCYAVHGHHRRVYLAYLRFNQEASSIYHRRPFCEGQNLSVSFAGC